jgi:hypothetical protein
MDDNQIEIIFLIGGILSLLSGYLCCSVFMNSMDKKKPKEDKKSQQDRELWRSIQERIK